MEPHWPGALWPMSQPPKPTSQMAFWPVAILSNRKVQKKVIFDAWPAAKTSKSGPKSGCRGKVFLSTKTGPPASTAGFSRTSMPPGVVMKGETAIWAQKE